MKIGSRLHLTYCTNIHPQKNWDSHFQTLKTIVPAIKQQVSPIDKFGIGLRLSDYCCRELLEDNSIVKLKNWLDENNLYVFTLNGFPYGAFHGQKVKDDVHKPDWATKERAEYTKRLSRVLAVLLPQGMEGGISTSPISYKPWFDEEPGKIKNIMRAASINFAQAVEEMMIIRKNTGKVLHIDIEPEPDGLLENTSDVINFFKNYLLESGVEYLIHRLSVTPGVAEESIRTHIRVCYDVCHFSVVFENHKKALERLAEEGIRIGKVQISAALKAEFSDEVSYNEKVRNSFSGLLDPIYLHQVRELNKNDEVIGYTDLPLALKQPHKNAKEWRVHYHVPVFKETFEFLESTQRDIREVIEIINKNNYTQHIEVETYTWEILPNELKEDLHISITRELEWVKNQLLLGIKAS